MVAHLLSTAPTGPQTQSALDFQAWEQAIEAANQVFEHGDDPRALRLYAEAWRCCSGFVCVRNWCGGGHPGGLCSQQAQCALDAAIAAFVVTAHNLAHVCERLQRWQEAGDWYRHTHVAVAALHESAELSEPLRELAGRHLTRTLGAWVQFKRRTGAWELPCEGPSTLQ